MLELILSKQDQSTNHGAPSLDEIARQGARQLLAKALQEEVKEYLNSTAHERDHKGHRQVVRNGLGKERTLLTGTGEIKLKAPRVNDRREGQSFSSKILPRYLRKFPNVESVLPLLYLKGLSANDFTGALSSLLGEGAKGLSKSSIHSLKRSWERDLMDWKQREIQENFVYLWVDGVYANVRLGDDKRACLLVAMGVTERGEKKLLAVEAGYRESKENWKRIFEDLQSRGLCPPLCVIGDGSLGLWGAVKEMEFFKKTREQRCWFHKMGNVLNKLPKRLQPKAKELLREMMRSDTKKDSWKIKNRFNLEFEAKYPQAVECLNKDWSQLTTYFDFPAWHWQHLRTTNPIESTFATVKQRTRATKGAGSVKMAEVMAFKLMLEAEKRWQRIRGYEEISNLLRGEVYKDGKLVQSPEKALQGAA